ncbi:MAG: carboxypeptidase-like regulatory domain-containing protein [Chitinophagaceae bacterium]|nr:carboxypeptidase-like regulatory domain-containing protein [Chitinophagaceae bacterium]HPA21786.1 carboxypeptidase-like regulatory domain-containing protein [Ferruginibacter sp.]HRB31215.1 carboxypeptidase-like regulatory domain-containing protein [Ferruginibacter sp.]
MNKFLQYGLLLFLLFPVAAKAQFESFKDSVVQLYGVVMTADSLQGIPAVSVMLKGQNRGTVTNNGGVFSIAVLKGDQVEFTSIGFKPVLAKIPANLEGNQYSLIQLMVNDTIFLPATILKPRPTKEQFERDFINAKVPDDEIAVARNNNNKATRQFLMAALPKDGKEASNLYLKQSATKLTYAGQLPPQNIFNPAAWMEFIKAWKRGDFKKKN